MSATHYLIRSDSRALVAPLLWLAAALAPMVASQLMRLAQTDAMAWLFWDYMSRLGALAVLVAIPSARLVAFQHEELRPPQWDSALKIVIGLVLAHYLFSGWLASLINALIPGTILGTYPILQGSLHVFDLIAGIALAAYHEEIVFRRVARYAFKPSLGDGPMMVFVTSLLFGAYHWWSGIGNITGAFLCGIALMLAYQRLQALWPLVVAHYLMDLAAFI